MKKILIIHTALEKGGAAKVASDIFKNLGNKYEVHFAYGRGTKSVQEKTFCFGNKLEQSIHIFLVRFFGLEGFGTYFSTKKLIGYIRHEKFDAVNLHNLHGYYVNFFMLINFLKEVKIPIVYSLHDEWSMTWLPAHTLGCVHCKTGVGECDNTYSYPKSYFPFFAKYMLRKKEELFSQKLNMVIACPSRWLEQSVLNSFLRNHKTQVISNSVDTDIFKPISDKNALRIKYNLPVDKKIVVFSASNLRDLSKGVHHIIEASEIIHDRNYLFLGLGGGAIKNSEGLKTTGYITDQRTLADLYALSDLFCFASYAETFLLSAAEALACGVPVVGFDIPVVRELVHDTVGLLTQKDSQSLACGIDTLLQDDAKRLEMGARGREIIENTYSKKTFRDKYEVLFESILNSHP